MSLNANALASVADFKGYIKLDGATDVDLIEKIINGVSDTFENYCNQKFIIIALTETYDGNGTAKLFTEYCPITALTEIQINYDDSGLVLQTITDFNYNPRAGIINSKFAVFPAGFQNIQVKYSAGHGAAMANLPADLRLAALKQAEFHYKRDSADFSSTFEEGMIIKAPADLLSPSVRDMLSPYFRSRGF